MAMDALIIGLRLLGVGAAIAAGYLAYKSSERLGGKLESRFRYLVVGTAFLALYGTITGLRAAGIETLTHEAWEVFHIILQLGATIPVFIGLVSLERFGGGEP